MILKEALIKPTPRRRNMFKTSMCIVCDDTTASEGIVTFYSTTLTFSLHCISESDFLKFVVDGYLKIILNISFLIFKCVRNDILYPYY